MAGFVLRRSRLTELFNRSSVFSTFCLRRVPPLHYNKMVIKSMLSQSFSYMGRTFKGMSPSGDVPQNLNIEVVDDDVWNLSLGIARSWKGPERVVETCEGTVNNEESALVDLDLEDIEDMRYQRSLFYKIDRNSREFEEYNFDFHGKKSPKGKEKPARKKFELECNKREKTQMNSLKHKANVDPCMWKDNVNTVVKKRTRVPTYNQLTDPYHEPFCLDIFISKSSIRACVIHRATSKVVAVAHSISKDMKHDLGSTKDYSACVAVGGVLAQRAIADDIYNVVYTPRKGEKIEGKLKTVLQSIGDAGIDVKLKIKQKRHMKT